MQDKPSKIIEDITTLKVDVRYIVQTMNRMQQDTKEVMDKFSNKIDEMALYHQEIGGYIKIAADNTKRLNNIEHRLTRIEKWRVAVVAGASVLLFLFLHNMITLQKLI